MSDTGIEQIDPQQGCLDSELSFIDDQPASPWRKRAIAVAVGGVAALVAWTQLPSPLEVEREAVAKPAEITLIEPVDIDMKVRTEADFEIEVSLNPKILGVDIANDYKVNTEGVVETLTGVKGEGVEIMALADGRQMVRIPLANVVFFSRIREDQTTSVMDYDAMAEVGRAVWGFAEAIGLGEGVNERLREKDAKLMQASREFGVNNTQQACGLTAWDVTEQLIIDGYAMAAQQQGINPDNVSVVIEPANELPNFTGPYQANDEFNYSIALEQGDSQGCRIAEDAKLPVLSSPGSESIG